VPRLDVWETKDAFVVKAEMPGVEPKEIEIALTGDLLTLKGEQAKDPEEKEERYLRVERMYGACLRSRPASDGGGRKQGYRDANHDRAPRWR
jgi:HSP20 family protein